MRVFSKDFVTRKTLDRLYLAGVFFEANRLFFQPHQLLVVAVRRRRFWLFGPYITVGLRLAHTTERTRALDMRALVQHGAELRDQAARVNRLVPAHERARELGSIVQQLDPGLQTPVSVLHLVDVVRRPNAASPADRGRAQGHGFLDENNEPTAEGIRFVSEVCLYARFDFSKEP